LIRCDLNLEAAAKVCLVDEISAWIRGRANRASAVHLIAMRTSPSQRTMGERKPEPMEASDGDDR